MPFILGSGEKKSCDEEMSGKERKIRKNRGKQQIRMDIKMTKNDQTN